MHGDDDRIDPRPPRPVRDALRAAGPVVLAVGGPFMIVGAVDFLWAFESFNPPARFGCFFVGMPLLFGGGVGGDRFCDPCGGEIAR